ncbi:MAG: hypothetical protein AAF196_02965 [Planctomycetota bacterium]
MTALEFSDEFLEVRTNLSAFDRLWNAGPEIVAFHARDMLGRWFGRHGREWRAQLTPKTRKLARRGVAYYYVDPRATSAAQIRAAFKSRGLDQRISGKLWMRSQVGLLLEFGGVVRPTQGRHLAIRTGRFARMTQTRFRSEIGRSPADYNRRNPRNQAFVRARKTRKGTNAALMRVKPGTESAKKPSLEAVWILRRQVVIEPQLRIREVWDTLEGYRQRTFGEALQRIGADLAKEVRSARSIA